MKTRIVAVYHSMRQLAAVVNSYPDLRARADESKAFELFLAVIADFESLLHEEASSPLELKQLAAHKKLLTADINLAIDVLLTTASLIPTYIPLPPFSAPPAGLTTFIFSVQADGLVANAAEHAPAFIEAGLHPRTFDDARSLIAQLVDADLQERLTIVRALSFPARLEITIDAARKRRRQLALDLRRAQTAESAAAWRSAYALGRTHRPRQLAAPAEPKLLTAPSDGDDDEPSSESEPGDGDDAEPSSKSEPGDGGIKRLARRVGLRLPGTGST